MVIVPLVPVIVPLVPDKLPLSVPVIFAAVPDNVCVVKTTVAIPLPLVVLVEVANDPLASDLLHVTTLPAVPTALLLASANCAVMFTSLPAIGL